MTESNYRVTWQTLKSDWPVFAAFLLDMAFALWTLPRLPDQVPIHWNAAGQADRWGSATAHALGMPFVAAGVYLLVLLSPMIDPRRRNYALFPSALRVTRILAPIFLMAVHALTILVALGYVANINTWVLLGLGAMITLMGNVMGQFRHNYFVGIRTAWTLASEEVWRRTHRMAAPFWVGAGLGTIMAAFLPGQWGVWVALTLLGIATIVPIGYSYWISLRQTRE